MPLLDEFGHEYSGLYQTEVPEVLAGAHVDTSEMWQMTMDAHDDEYTGEATIDRELHQKEINAQCNVQRRICFDL